MQFLGWDFMQSLTSRQEPESNPNPTQPESNPISQGHFPQDSGINFSDCSVSSPGSATNQSESASDKLDITGPSNQDESLPQFQSSPRTSGQAPNRKSTMVEAKSEPILENIENPDFGNPTSSPILPTQTNPGALGQSENSMVQPLSELFQSQYFDYHHAMAQQFQAQFQQAAGCSQGAIPVSQHQSPQLPSSQPGPSRPGPSSHSPSPGSEMASQKKNRKCDNRK